MTMSFGASFWAIAYCCTCALALSIARMGKDDIEFEVEHQPYRADIDSPKFRAVDFAE
jgi:hypothetical protein